MSDAPEWSVSIDYARDHYPTDEEFDTVMNGIQNEPGAVVAGTLSGNLNVWLTIATSDPVAAAASAVKTIAEATDASLLGRILSIETIATDELDRRNAAN